jgi:hypothetical protein
LTGELVSRGVCLQPWPNDFFTRPDASTPTGKRLNLPLLGMPRNAAGVPIRPDEYNRNDGFLPLAAVMSGPSSARGAQAPRVRRR